MAIEKLKQWQGFSGSQYFYTGKWKFAAIDLIFHRWQSVDVELIQFFTPFVQRFVNSVKCV